jgi:hypothetical protein
LPKRVEKNCFEQSNFSKDKMKKKIKSPKSKFQTLAMKIDILGTCPNFQLSPIGTMVLYPMTPPMVFSFQILSSEYETVIDVRMMGLRCLKMATER